MMDFAKSSLISEEIVTTHQLLLENDIYLERCKSRSITLDSLGLIKLNKYDKYASAIARSNKKHYSSKKKSSVNLQAVIPDNDQQDFLNSIGLTTTHGDSYMFNSLVNQSSSLYTSSAMTRKSSASFKKKNYNYLMPIHNSKELPPNPSRIRSSPPRLNDDGVPIYSQLPRRIIDTINKERDEAIEKNKLIERLKRVSSHYDIVKDGVKMVYDRQGIICSEEEYLQTIEMQNKEKEVEVVKSEGPFFEGAIIEKSADIVRLRREMREEDELREILMYKCKWKPGKFPSTTISFTNNSRPSRASSPISSVVERKNAQRRSVFGRNTVVGTTNAATAVIDESDNYIMDECLPMNFVRTWPEYSIIENDDVVVTIEHCWECWKHRDITHHNEEKYMEVAEAVRAALVETARQFEIRLYAVLKPAESMTGSSGSDDGAIMTSTTMKANPQNNSKKVFEIDYSKRCGALEVQVAFKTPADNNNNNNNNNNRPLISHILFSKIFHGCWPVLKELQALFEYLLDSYHFQRVDDSEPPILDLDVIDVLKSKKKKKMKQGTKKMFLTNRKSATAAVNNMQSLEAEFDFRKPKI